ncbi:ABC transporter permease [Chlamydiota bacterium]
MKLLLIVWDNFWTAFTMMMSNKLRSVLSVLGMVFGVATLITTISIGEGTRFQVLKAIESMGSNLIVISPNVEFERVKQEGYFPLTSDDVIPLENIPEIEYLAPETNAVLNTSYNDNETHVLITGTTPPFKEIRDYYVARGRFIVDYDIETKAKVCVLGAGTKKTLFKEKQAVGKTIQLGTDSYYVIGAMKEKGRAFNMDFDNRIVVPVTSLQEQMGRSKLINRIIIKVKESYEIRSAVLEIKNVLREIRKGREDYEVWDQEELLKKKKRMAQVFKIALGSIAIISLVIGGIGIMNVLLISVTERIKEVGLRKALGATVYDIILQFIFESLLLSAAGGIIGITIGSLLGDYVAQALTKFIPEEGTWLSIVSFESIIISFCFSVLVGFIFGIYPAIKASSLDPCEALTYE